MIDDKGEIDLYEAVCLGGSTVVDVPPEVARRLLAPETDSGVPLLAIAYRGSVPLRQRRETATFIAAPPHLGVLVGLISAAVDQMDERARAMFVSAYDQGYAAGRGRPADGRREAGS